MEFVLFGKDLYLLLMSHLDFDDDATTVTTVDTWVSRGHLYIVASDRSFGVFLHFSSCPAVDLLLK